MSQVGIDLGGTAIKAGRISAAGEILAEISVEPRFERGPAAVLSTLADIFRELGGGARLGVGVPGLLDRARGHLITSPNLPGFVDVAVRDELARWTGLAAEAVFVENDANAAAVGELWLGAGRGVRDALVVTLAPASAAG
jgi:glucokinase